MLQEMVDVVWIRAKDAQWTLPGCPPGVYPIRPVTGTWYVDKNSYSPQLQTHRKQIPLLPGFACTANAAQGGNWSAAITDINIAGGMSPQAAYVSLSRVKEKNSIWILRPFPQHRFARPARRGPDLLLKQLRGEKIDWGEVAEAFNKSKQNDNKIVTPHLLCAQCARLSPCENFTLQQLRQEAARKCIACTGAARCATCETIMDRQVCQQCAGLRECRQCCRWLLPGDFAGPKPQCSTCRTTSRAMVCGRCTLWKPLMKFRHCAAESPSSMGRRLRRRCDACWEEEVESKRRSHVAVAAGMKRGPEGTLPSAKRARTSRE